MVRLGFHSTHFSPTFGGSTPLRHVLQATASAGFDVIGLDLASVTAGFAPGADSDAVRHVRDLMIELDLACSDVLAIIVGDPDITATARRLGLLGAALGAPVCVAAVLAEMSEEDLRTTVGEAAAIVNDHGMRLGIEFLPYSPLSTLRMAADVCDATGWDRCGLVLDSLHFHRARTPLQELLALEPAQIALIQFSDAPDEAPVDLVAESRHGRLLPGAGALPLGEWVEAVKTVGFDGVISAEVLSAALRAGDPLAAALACRLALEAHWLP